MPGLLSITELSQVMQNISVYGDELRKLMTYPSKPKFPPVLPSGKEIEELKCELLGYYNDFFVAILFVELKSYL